MASPPRKPVGARVALLRCSILLTGEVSIPWQKPDFNTFPVTGWPPIVTECGRELRLPLAGDYVFDGRLRRLAAFGAHRTEFIEFLQGLADFVATHGLVSPFNLCEPWLTF